MIDLFVNSLNHRLPLYVSPCPDTQALAVNVYFTYYANAVTGTGLREACENLSIPTNFCRLNPTMITDHDKAMRRCSNEKTRLSHERQQGRGAVV